MNNKKVIRWSLGIIIAMLLINAYFSKPNPVTSTTAEQKTKGHISSAEYGGRWAFNVDSVVLRCERGSAVVARIGDKDYGLNGTAFHIGFDRLPNDIWKDQPNTGAKVSIGPFIDAGKKLCESDKNE